MPDIQDLTAAQAKRDATQDQPEWFELLDSARDEISDATLAVLGHARTVVNGKLKSMSPHRELALDLLRSAVKSIQKAMGEI